MGRTSINISNANKPAPKWYRKTRRVLGLLSGPSFFAVFVLFDLSEATVAKIGIFISWLPTLLEILNAILANGEEYAPAVTTEIQFNRHSKGFRPINDTTNPSSPPQDSGTGRIISVLLIGILFFSSCVTQERCNAKFPPGVTYKDSTIYHDSITWRDTTIYLHGESVQIRDTVFCDSLNRAQMATKTVKAGHVTALVGIKNGRIEVLCKEDSLIAVIASLKNRITTLTSKKQKTIVLPPLEKVEAHWYDIALRWVALFLFIWFIWSTRKFWMKLFI